MNAGLARRVVFASLGLGLGCGSEPSVGVDDETMAEWEWSEKYATQPEILLRTVAAVGGALRERGCEIDPEAAAAEASAVLEG